jgi:wobble nucleotide-excising tRNase
MGIERIEKIKDHKIFRYFMWSSNLENFKRYNLIYGWNGTGKTILSNLFRAIEKKQQIVPGEFAVKIGDRIIESKSFPSETTLPCAKVFNRDFVNENVFTLQGSISPIFFLGEKNIEKQQRIETFKKEQEVKQKDSTAKGLKVTGLEGDLDNFCIQHAKAIKELLSSSGTNQYNNYDKRDFKTKCNTLNRSFFAKLTSFVQHNYF